VAIPKGLDPTGVILVDKPEGPSSFAVVDRVRRRTGARTGHAGTLDPFATGLLLLLSGRATKLAQRFSGLDKRYVTEIDLAVRTTTGDREGQPLEPHEPLSGGALDEALAALLGEIKLPIPAASAVKIDGQRAYRLHRRGVVVDMPLRRSQVYSLAASQVEPGLLRLDVHVSAGTYVRSLADALGGHCRTLRRVEIGPFSVDEADELRVVEAADALARLA
jgi:tRNA pseudouridine55 synthase